MILFGFLVGALPHAVAAAAHLTVAQPALTAPQGGGPLSFDGAKLGMTVDAWKALPLPPGVASDAAADCGAPIVAALREEGIAATPTADRTICAYDARFGGEVLLDSARLDAHVRIDALRYGFAGGRLGEVDFTAPGGRLQRHRGSADA